MEQKYICPSCKSILIIDNNNGRIECPNCNREHNLSDYNRVFTIDYQCKNCNRKWVVASRQDKGFPNQYVCPTCRCSHFGQINHSIKDGNCPHCNQELKFAIELGKEPNKLSCSHCNFNGSYNQFFDEISLPDDRNTVSFIIELIKDRPDKGKGWYGPSKIIDFTLKPGETKKIGRQSGSIPDVKLPTNDDIMSRCHILASIEPTINGSKIKITHIGANDTLVNSKKIEKEVPVVLNDNDTITMGRSIFTIKKIVHPPVYNRL